MALNFPTNPSINDVYTYGGKTWSWDGNSWISTGAQSLSTDKVDRASNLTRSGAWSDAVGKGHDITGDTSFAEGDTNIIIGNTTHAEGYANTINGDYAHIEGKSNISYSHESHTEGINNTLTSSPENPFFVFGIDDFLKQIIIQKQILMEIPSVGSFIDMVSTIEMKYIKDIPILDVVVDAAITLTLDTTEDISQYSIFYPSIANKQNPSHAEGELNILLGYAGHVEGQSNISFGRASHAEGQNTLAQGSYSHAEGAFTAAIGYASHAEGMSTEGSILTASGQASHAEGVSTLAEGYSSHAEGLMTTAFGDSSHAEGEGAYASGQASHAEGKDTYAAGLYSHAEGRNSEAIGNYSHASGSYSIASGEDQTVVGRNNIDDLGNVYAFIIGNGIDMRSNAFAVQWDGEVYSATGKQLSEENFTTEEKAALANKVDKVSITNLVGNGNFPNTDGWGNVNATLSVENNTLISLVTNTATSWASRFYYDTGLNMIEGHQYYTKCSARVTTPDCYGMYVQLREPSFEILNSIYSITPPIGNQWYDISSINSNLYTSSGLLFYAIHEYATEEAATAGRMEVQNVMLIDLTASFGAGNEPTLSQMNSLISYYVNNYVSSTDNNYITTQHDLDGVRDLVENKVDKVAGMGLSSNDYTDADKALLDSFANTNILGELTDEPTGFTNNSTIDIVYSPIDRTITLNGTFQAYYLGVLIEGLVDGWVSDPHDDFVGTYFLYYNGNSFIFSTDAWNFEYLQIAFVQYGTTHKFAVRETHGFMPYTVHKNIHQTIGTYKTAGGDFSSFTPNSTTPSDRRPDVSSTTLADEDLQSVIGSLTSKTYTQRYLTGSAVRTITAGATEIIPVNASEPYWNRNTNGVWSQQLFANGEYGAIFVIAVPTTSDADSLTYRYMFMQPQQVSSTLSVIQGLSPTSVVLGDDVLFIAEFVFIGKIIVRRASNNWHITSISKLDGTKISQVAYTANSALTVVNTDSTLTGDGTPSSPIGVPFVVTFDLTSPNNYDIIKYDSTAVKWKPKPDTYSHQQMVASDTWVIDHNLGKYPSVHVFDGFGMEVIGDIVFNSLTQVTLTFSGSFSGNAYLN